MEKFNSRLKELRTSKKLSTRNLAEAIGVSNAQISRWENGLSDITSVYIISLAKFFNVSTDYLLGLEN